MFRVLITLLLLAGCIAATAQSADDSLSEQVDRGEERALQGKEDAEEWIEPAGIIFQRPPQVILNKADSQALSRLEMLSLEQIEQFLLYRKVMGKLVSLFELQAIPGWDSKTIQRLLPYVTLNEPWAMKESWSSRWTGGQSQLLFRWEKQLAKKREALQNNGMGAAHRVLIRYSYQFKHLFAYGLTLEKDPGEKFSSPNYQFGPDFKSGYMLFRDVGPVKTLIVGDYAVNMGQGLLQWQSLAFGKGGDLLALKGAAAVLLPYRSLQENNFYRGAAFTCGWRHSAATLFLSSKKVDAHLDSSGESSRQVRSFLTDGFHRTSSELSTRKNMAQFSWGGQWVYSSKQGHIALNMIRHQFNLPLFSSVTPYKIYAPRGSRFMNYGFDYAYTMQNVHWFGEWAATQEGAKAGLFGALIVLHPKLDAGILYRRIDPGYFSFYSDAFLESSAVSNERGFYTGLTFRPTPTLQCLFYVDVFRFPWLKYGIDRPSEGFDQQSTLVYTPHKKWSLRLRFQSSRQAHNENASEAPFSLVLPNSLVQFRSQMTFIAKPFLQLTCRMDWKRVRGSGAPEEGWYTYIDLHYKGRKTGSAQFRCLYYETSSYASRLFAYESGVKHQFRIASFYGKGLRWNFSFNRSLNLFWNKDHFRKFNFSVFIAQNLPDRHSSVGNTAMLSIGTSTLEVRLQGIFTF